MYETLLMRYRQAAREGAELAARLEQGQAVARWPNGASSTACGKAARAQ